MADNSLSWKTVTANDLSRMLLNGLGKCLVIDSRSFLEFNTYHIAESVNVSSSKLIKRRLQQDKLCVQELLSSSCRVDIDIDYDIIIYDQCTVNPSLLALDCFLVILVNKLHAAFRNVYLLKGGFLEFQATHPSLCKSQTMCSSSSGSGYKCPPMTYMSQPCLPVSNVGPTKILPFLFLGSQHDALSQETMQQNGITYILNVSTTSPRPTFIQEGHFLRIPVNDSYCDKLLPFFQEAFQFLDKVRESSSCALVHCLAGISRSPTLAIAYIMRYLGMTTDEAYKYVKDKRPTISPNFNFLGQLLEYEQLLQGTRTPSDGREVMTAHHVKRPCTVELLSPLSPTATTGVKGRVTSRTLSLHSPTTALSLLNFTQPSPVTEEATPVATPSDSSDDGTSRLLADSTAFTCLPVTAIDRLDFKSCFACVDALQPALTHGNSRTASKRLLTECNRPLHNDFQTSGDCVVTLRPQSKRQLTRPNSIPFSPLSATMDDGGCDVGQMDAGKLGTELTGSAFVERVTRKSRSLEDILNSPIEIGEAHAEQNGVYMAPAVLGRLPSAVDILGPSTLSDIGDISSRYWPVTGLTGSQRETAGSGGGAGGVSSGSLHGSAEVIEVL